MIDPAMQDLIDAMRAQTEAINSLAESNRQIVDYLVAQEADQDDDGDASPRTYLDGTPCP